MIKCRLLAVLSLHRLLVRSSKIVPLLIILRAKISESFVCYFAYVSKYFILSELTLRFM